MMSLRTTGVTMSKGPGVKQRLILDEVERRPWGFYLVELLPDNHSEAEYQALHRACMNLYAQGRVTCIRYTTGTRRQCRYGKLLLLKPGLMPPVNRLSVKGIT